MPKLTDQYTTIPVTGGSLKFRRLDENFFRLEETLLDENSSKLDCPHKIGALFKLEGGSLISASVMTDEPREYVPKEKHPWESLSLDEIGLIHGTDKSSSKHNLLKDYEKIFLERFGRNWRNKTINLIEIGICNGSSIRTWARAIPNGQVLGVDNIKACTLLCRDISNVHLVHADATDQSLLDKVYPCHVIIDDGRHLVQDISKSLKLLWGILEKGGIYIIEDTLCMYNMNYIRDLENNLDVSEYKLERMKFIDTITKMVNKRIINYLQIHRNYFILFKS